MNATVEVLRELMHPAHNAGDWSLWLQWCTYNYTDGSSQDGYRFIWKHPDGKLQAARGQARIPSLYDAELLIAYAKQDGWGFMRGDLDPTGEH